ncbi:DUF3857 domain-containing protein [Lutimonas sp.]|uniref:DUF3857 domain-containing protein n=1 Tax=Lutimonas sp. TaxID=1872403 RepID=UPI003D9B3659
MKKSMLVAMLILVSTLQSQNKNQLPYTFGKISTEALQMTSYPKDPEANALVLFEHSNVSFHGSGSYSNYMVNKVYRKIKIFNEEGYDNATIHIYLYKSDSNGAESIKNIKGFTYNDGDRTVELKPEKVFRTTLNERYDEVSFTFPNLKPGSIIEYQYEVRSDFFFNLVGWNFQSDIPKLHSEFHAVIPGFWNYNRHLNGSLALNTNLAIGKNDCFQIQGAYANCEDLTYAMVDVPAFKEAKKYNTASKNYISKIEFELSRVNYPDGTSKEFTSTWEKTDQYLKQKQSVGKQLKNESHLKKNLPADLFKIKDDEERAQAIFYNLQKHFSLDEENADLYHDVQSKKAFDKKAGSVPEINLSLINALNAANLEAHIMLVSTRDHGFPTKKHPVITDFNYMLVYLKINEQTYLLDASDKFMTFGQTPFKTLNGQGRVLDFKNGSFWYSLSPKIDSREMNSFDMVLDLDGTLKGRVTVKSEGYDASWNRKKITELPAKEYLDYLESRGTDILIDNYDNNMLHNLDSTLIENFDIEIELDTEIEDQIYFNPLIIRYAENPFLLKERNYPVNFGYKLNEMSKIKISLPQGYTVKNLPKSALIKLPNKGGSFAANYTVNNNELIVFTHLKLNYTIYNTEKYQSLKDLFKEIIKNSNSLISLEKTTDS